MLRPLWQAQYGSMSTARSRRSPTTIPKSTTRSTTTWTLQLFGILDQLAGRADIRAVVWRGEGKSFSSGRDVGSIGTQKTELSHHELMRRGHRGVQRLWDIDAPVIVACKGWVMGGSFQRALLCDIRIAAEGTRFRLPELSYGVIPDTGGVGVALRDVRPRPRE